VVARYCVKKKIIHSDSLQKNGGDFSRKDSFFCTPKRKVGLFTRHKIFTRNYLTGGINIGRNQGGRH